MVEASRRFRPLAGIMVLIDYYYSASRRRFPVSVPLRGLWFLSHRRIVERGYRRKRFRPLAGIMVLIAKKYRRDEGWENLVSVPLRGLWFLSQQAVH